jgi:long-subunit acyl-CoA synthetase (AMP-forming)
VKFVAVGGARVSDSDLEAATKVGIPAYQGYGLSECASVVALNRPGDQRAGSVGRPLPGVDVAVSHDGEILVSNQCMHGYLGEPDAQVSAVATGDLGYLDDDGFLYVTGRRKNLFITSYGRNVAPEWPESELLAQRSIAQVCVFGEARPKNIAVIVPASGSVTRIARAVHLANRALPDYARVAEWLIADEPFSPANGLMTATGKARREAIARRYLVDCRPVHVHAVSPLLSTSLERTDHEFL